MKNKINAKIVADSINKQGDRITSFVLTYPRMINSELMTHRLFSRNSASSRAIPFEKMVDGIVKDPFVPVAWQIDHPGMQGKKYITDPELIKSTNERWIGYSLYACENATRMNNGLMQYVNKKGTGLREDFEWIPIEETNVTKQLCNRMLEPYAWHTVLVTATEYDNFFELRCPIYRVGDKTFKSWRDLILYNLNDLKANRDVIESLENTSILDRLMKSESLAEIHIQLLAEAMWDALNKNKPNLLMEGAWHLPFGDRIDVTKFESDNQIEIPSDQIMSFKLKISTARCAKLSYMTFDGKIDYEKDLKFHDRLLNDRHFSPFEHCARAMSDFEYITHIKGVSLSYNKGLEEGKCRIGQFAFKDNSLGWSRNLKGFIQYRELID